jgi:ketosteroid isomerase-like protein
VVNGRPPRGHQNEHEEDRDVDETARRELSDKGEIQDVALRTGTAADGRDWEALISCYTEDLDLDYTSLTGGEPERIDARELVLKRWAPTFGVLDATQHLTGPCTVVVDGDRAMAHTYFQATHVLADAEGGDKWTLGGRYDWTFARGADGWKISGVIMTAVWDGGNGDLMAQASARAAG